MIPGFVRLWPRSRAEDKHLGLHDQGRRRLLGLLIGWGVLAVGCAGLAIGISWHLQDDDRREDLLRETLSRATVAEGQLALMLKHGDGGVLPANIDTRDLGRAEIRLVPAGRARR